MSDICPGCLREVTDDERYRNRAFKGGLDVYCKPCRRRRNADTYRRRRLRLPDPRREGVAEGEKRCSDCREAKPLSEFVMSNGRPFSYCKPCHNLRGKKLKEKYGGSRSYHLRRRYGIDDVDVERMIEEQGGVCAICLVGTPQHVDHDHGTGKIRGILCFNCNGGLGQFKDRVDVLRNAVTYLETSGGAAS